jgi:hypothetical protein
MEIRANEKQIQIEDEKKYTSPLIVVNKFRTRKNIETVSKQTKKKNAKPLLDMLDETVGEENVTTYLDFVDQLNNKRKKIKNDNRNVNNENENDIHRIAFLTFISVIR